MYFDQHQNLINIHVPIQTDQINQTIRYINSNINSLDVLLQVEKIFDDCGLYAYDNWYLGEVIEGPKISKYWVEVTLLYPKKKMPEPVGGLRLTKYGCKVFYVKDKFVHYNRVINTNIDIVNTSTKEASKKDIDIWLITVKIPRRLIDDAIDRYLDLENAAEMNLEAEELEDNIDNNVEGHNDENPDNQINQEPEPTQEEQPLQ